MKLEQRISAFSRLGEILRDSLSGKPTEYTNKLNRLVEDQQLENPWFTPENIRMAAGAAADELTESNLKKWCSSYPGLNDKSPHLKVAVIMAGNIPMVGFHDLLCVLLTGNRIIAKISSKDKDLISFLCEILSGINNEFKDSISITEGPVSGFDVVIATGTDNSSRYFDYYFGRYPHIIRRNRNSIAVLDGTETDDELVALGTDVFSYFGLGCRNVSRILIPSGYSLEKLAGNWNSYSGIINHNKYGNNYDFHKAVFLINREKFMDTGYLLLKEHDEISSPVAVLYYGYYKTQKDLEKYFRQMRDKIQSVVGHGYIPFGRSQKPALWDYADGTDTIEFLLKKKSPVIL